MSFSFEWPQFSEEFYSDAKAMLAQALNKGEKPPIIADAIEVKELDMGSIPPQLEILEIGELSTDKFRGIFRLTYSGNAYIGLQTKIQANPLTVSKPSVDLLGTPRIMFAAAPLVVPMTLRLSNLSLRAIVVLVVSRQKGITLVFKNDPLQSVKVSSSFDGVKSVAGYIQRQIEHQLREAFRSDLPSVIHRLSQQWLSSQMRKEQEERDQRNRKNRSKGARKGHAARKIPLNAQTLGLLDDYTLPYAAPELFADDARFETQLDYNSRRLRSRLHAGAGSVTVEDYTRNSTGVSPFSLSEHRSDAGYSQLTSPSGSNARPNYNQKRPPNAIERARAALPDQSSANLADTTNRLGLGKSHKHRANERSFSERAPSLRYSDRAHSFRYGNASLPQSPEKAPPPPRAGQPLRPQAFMRHGRSASLVSAPPGDLRRYDQLHAPNRTFSDTVSVADELESVPDMIESYDPTYGLRPHSSLPLHSDFADYENLIRSESLGKGLGDILEDAQPERPRTMLLSPEHKQRVLVPLDEDVDYDLSQMYLDDTYDPDVYETIPAVGGGIVTRPRVVHGQSRSDDSGPAGRAGGSAGGADDDSALHPSTATLRPAHAPSLGMHVSPLGLHVHASPSSSASSDDDRRSQHSSSADEEVMFPPARPTPIELLSRSPSSVLNTTYDQDLPIVVQDDSCLHLTTLTHSNQTLSPFTLLPEHVTSRSSPMLVETFKEKQKKPTLAPTSLAYENFGDVKMTRKRVIRFGKAKAEYEEKQRQKLLRHQKQGSFSVAGVDDPTRRPSYNSDMKHSSSSNVAPSEISEYFPFARA